MRRWMDRVEAARHAHLSVKVFSRRVRAGLLPQGYLLGDGKRLWSADEIDLAMRRWRSAMLGGRTMSADKASSPTTREEACRHKPGSTMT